MHGLMRVRGFTQDDAHIFCTEDQLAEECLKINDLILSTYADFGFTGDLTVKLSTRPEKRVGTDEMWDHAERVMATVLREIQSQSNHIKTEINPGEGAFYGPKFEYVLRDAIGRDWQCGTTQVDFNLPERFGAFYIDHDRRCRRRAGIAGRVRCGRCRSPRIEARQSQHAARPHCGVAHLPDCADADDVAAAVRRRLSRDAFSSFFPVRPSPAKASPTAPRGPACRDASSFQRARRRIAARDRRAVCRAA